MPLAPTNDAGYELFYETFGSPEDPATLLIMGLGGQMIVWKDSFCDAVVAGGRHVIRFDNRDIGLSTGSQGDAPDPMALIMAKMTGAEVEAPYLLADMAADTVGLLDHLGIEAAHLVGASMGGMIAQEVAIGHPGRTLSLTSIMSTTGAADVGQPDPEIAMGLLAAQPTTAAEAVETGFQVEELISGELFDAEVSRVEAARRAERSFRPEANQWQLSAITASPDRTEALASLAVPTLVIHGDQDRLVTPSGGAATAAAVPGARLMTFPKMGHDVPAEYVDDITEAIIALR